MADAASATTQHARFTAGRLLTVVVLGIVAAGALAGRFLVRHQVHDLLAVAARDRGSEDALERRAVAADIAPAGTALSWIAVVAVVVLLLVLARALRRRTGD